VDQPAGWGFSRGPATNTLSLRDGVGPSIAQREPGFQPLVSCSRRRSCRDAPGWRAEATRRANHRRAATPRLNDSDRPRMGSQGACWGPAPTRRASGAVAPSALRKSGHVVDSGDVIATVAERERSGRMAAVLRFVQLDNAAAVGGGSRESTYTHTPATPARRLTGSSSRAFGSRRKHSPDDHELSGARKRGLEIGLWGFCAVSGARSGRCRSEHGSPGS
jgi:hypothetical protein